MAFQQVENLYEEQIENFANCVMKLWITTRRGKKRSEKQDII
jgi:hypothetical protein